MMGKYIEKVSEETHEAFMALGRAAEAARAAGDIDLWLSLLEARLPIGRFTTEQSGRLLAEVEKERAS